MKSKVVSFLKGIGYVAIAFGSQLVVGIIYGIISMFNIISKYGIENFENNADEIYSVLMNTMDKDTNVILLISAIMYLLITALIYKFGKKKIIEDFGLENNNMKSFIIAAPLGLSVWLINTGILSLVQQAGLMEAYFQSFEEVTGVIGRGSIFMTILVVGIVVPFTEEFLFRGVIQRTFSKSISIKAAIIMQGILFGIYHGNLIQCVYATFLGIVFGYITYRYKSIWPAVIMHMVNNSIASTAHYIFPESLENAIGYITLAMIGIIILAVSLVFVKKNNSVIEEEKEIPLM